MFGPLPPYNILSMAIYTHTPTLCNELLSLIPKSTFSTLLGQHKTDKRSKKFNTRKTFITLFVAQVSWVESMRHIWTELECHSSKLYHLWLWEFKRATFSDRINKVPPEIYQNVFYNLLSTTQKLISKKHIARDLWKVYAIDSTVISLCLSVFDRAHYRKKKWAIKLHTRLELSSALPDFVQISVWKKSDVSQIEVLLNDIKSWSTVVFDRGYYDYEYWHKLTMRKILFVTRTKKNTEYTPIKHNEILDSRVLYDAEVEFVWESSYQKYPEKLRVVRYIDPETWKMYEYITNAMNLTAIEIADLYKRRREIETLFRRLKQNLKIKQFLWSSKNAVENQVWVALIYFLIVALIKEKTRCKESMLELTRKISCLLFERVKILHILWLEPQKVIKATSPPQSSLFDI